MWDPGLGLWGLAQLVFSSQNRSILALLLNAVGYTHIYTHRSTRLCSKGCLQGEIPPLKDTVGTSRYMGPQETGPEDIDLAGNREAGLGEKMA